MTTGAKFTAKNGFEPFDVEEIVGEWKSGTGDDEWLKGLESVDWIEGVEAGTIPYSLSKSEQLGSIKVFSLKGPGYLVEMKEDAYIGIGHFIYCPSEADFIELRFRISRWIFERTMIQIEREKIIISRRRFLHRYRHDPIDREWGSETVAFGDCRKCETSEEATDRRNREAEKREREKKDAEGAKMEGAKKDGSPS